jgi:hypothetical protein
MTTTDTTYNGWTNYPTWAVALWIDNDEPLYRESRRRAKGIHKDAHACDGGAHVLADNAALSICENCSVLMTAACEPLQTPEEHEVSTLAKGLEAWLTEKAPELGGTVWADLLGHALAAVNWPEIAKHVLEELE